MTSDYRHLWTFWRNTFWAEGAETKPTTWLEIFPSIQLYTANNDPARGSFTEKVEQDPMLIIESHLTHNFTKKLWVGVETGQNNISADMLRFSLVFAYINLKKLNLKTN